MKRFFILIIFLFFLIGFSFLGSFSAKILPSHLIIIACFFGLALISETEDNFYLFLFTSFLLEYFSFQPFGVFSLIILVVFMISEYFKEEIYSMSNHWYQNLGINFIFWIVIDFFSITIVYFLEIFNIYSSLDLINFNNLLNYIIQVLAISVLITIFNLLGKNIFNLFKNKGIKL